MKGHGLYMNKTSINQSLSLSHTHTHTHARARTYSFSRLKVMRKRKHLKTKISILHESSARKDKIAVIILPLNIWQSRLLLELSRFKRSFNSGHRQLLPLRNYTHWPTQKLQFELFQSARLKLSLSVNYTLNNSHDEHVTVIAVPVYICLFCASSKS